MRKDIIAVLLTLLRTIFLAYPPKQVSASSCKGGYMMRADLADAQDSEFWWPSGARFDSVSSQLPGPWCVDPPSFGLVNLSLTVQRSQSSPVVRLRKQNVSEHDRSTVFKLPLDVLRPATSGHYVFTADFPAFTLQILTPPKVSIVQANSSAAGGAFLHKCCARAYPMPTVSWILTDPAAQKRSFHVHQTLEERTFKQSTGLFTVCSSVTVTANSSFSLSAQCLACIDPQLFNCSPPKKLKDRCAKLGNCISSRVRVMTRPYQSSSSTAPASPPRTFVTQSGPEITSLTTLQTPTASSISKKSSEAERPTNTSTTSAGHAELTNNEQLQCTGEESLHSTFYILLGAGLPASLLFFLSGYFLGRALRNWLDRHMETASSARVRPTNSASDQTPQREGHSFPERESLPDLRLPAAELEYESFDEPAMVSFDVL